MIKAQKAREALPEQTSQTLPEQISLFYVLIHIPQKTKRVNAPEL